jgi:nucleoid-associated protein YgaU
MTVWAAAWAAWLLAAYLVICIAACGLVTARRIHRRESLVAALSPGLVRRLVAVALGAGLATSGVVAVPAAGAERPHRGAAAGHHRATTASLDWPGMGRAVHPVSRRVLVRPGDSLWSVAARALGRAATTPAIAAAWPAWWAANRRVVGPDPDLIHPGQRLVPPATQPRRR